MQNNTQKYNLSIKHDTVTVKKWREKEKGPEKRAENHKNRVSMKCRIFYTTSQQNRLPENYSMIYLTYVL